MFHTRYIVPLLLIVWIARSTAPLHAALDARPNVVLIMADDLGYECLSCYGSASYRTPHLDRLAAGGVRFDHCYSQPLCTPTRVKIMTGRYNFRNYVEFGYLDPAETTIGHVMQRAGYHTAIAGKWQLNGLSYALPDYDDPRRALRAGFDAALLWQLTQPKNRGERYADALIESPVTPPGIHRVDYGPQDFADFICGEISAHRDEPFFIYYPMALVHNPFVPTPDSPAWNDDPHRRNNKFFAHMVAYMDKVVGQIDAHLASLGLRDNTLLIFTGDNGTNRAITSRMTDGRTIKGGKGTTTDAGTRVPLIVSWPSVIDSPRVCNDLIDFTDFLPTIAAATGADVSDHAHDGVSFLPQLNGQPGTAREAIFCHYEPRWGGRDTTITRYARDRNYQLYADGRLIDVNADPQHERPLTDDTDESRDARRRLQAVLDAQPTRSERPLRDRVKLPRAQAAAN